MAYGETISQKAYYIASAASKIYCHPSGGLEWNGLSANLFFIKNLLDRLEIKPQIFYAGKIQECHRAVARNADDGAKQTTDKRFPQRPVQPHPANRYRRAAM